MTVPYTFMAILIAIVMTSFAHAQRGQTPFVQDNVRPSMLDDIGIDQKLDTQLPLDLIFRDEDGNPVRLGDLMQGRPVVLSLVYYGCPQLCGIVLNNMLRSFSAVPLLIGKDYDVITISFDPSETPALAADKKRGYIRRYAAGDRAAAESSARNGWHFLTGDQEAINRITQAVGFRYKYDAPTKQFFHPSGITILTPQGKIARYFFGIDYEPKDLRLSLMEASDNKIGTLTDHVLLYCFHYDSATGKYGLAIMRGVRVAGVITILGLVSGIVWMIRRDRQQPGVIQ
ncbi:MAG: SCO family protein [Anaerolineae bacterium]|nr:SCO family protein [Phycisphaerae bacterium]